MKNLFLLLCVSGATAILCTENFASDKKPTCEPGYRIVEETVYREVSRCVCKLVPDVQKKKKWVYSTKDESFCIKRTLGFGCCDNDCVECAKCRGPFCKKLLIKREIVEECPTMKCVVETIIEKVPCTVYRKVPIGQPDNRCEPPASSPKESIKPISLPYGRIPENLLPRR